MSGRDYVVIGDSILHKHDEVRKVLNFVFATITCVAEPGVEEHGSACAPFLRALMQSIAHQILI